MGAFTMECVKFVDEYKEGIVLIQLSFIHKRLYLTEMKLFVMLGLKAIAVNNHKRSITRGIE